MSDDTYTLKFTGEDKDLVEKIDKITDRLNKNRELSVKFNRDRSAIARQERKTAFESLSLEERRTRLTQRQVELERKLATARSSGNDYRASALQLAMARNKQALGGLRQGGGSWASNAAVFASAGRFLGPAAIFGALTGAARSALRFADETSDLADQMGITREQVVQITRAAGAAGVNVRQVMGGLSTLSANRSAALGGDLKAQALFAKYGGNPNEGNILTLAQQISGSLGAGGLGSKDRGAMGQLFGRRPEAIIAALRSIQDIGNFEDDIAKVDAANAKIESFWNTVKEGMVKTAAAVISAGEYAMKIDRQTTGTLAGRGGIGFGTFTPAVKGFTEGLGFGAKRRAEDTVLTPAGPAKPATPLPPIIGSIPQADSLARMGLYIGGGPNSTAGIMRQQLSELKAIKDASRATTQSIRNI